MTDFDARHRELKARRLRRRRIYSHLFVVPPVALIVASAVFQDVDHVYTLPAIVLVCAILSCLQAKYLKMPSPAWWGIAGLLCNVFAMVYLLGYAHGKGLPAQEP